MVDIKDLSDEERDKLEEAAQDPEFKKFVEEEQKRKDALDNNPYTLARKTLDEEFELSITYRKEKVPTGYTDETETKTLAEAMFEEENPDALITNDLYIISITPDVNQVVLAKEDVSKIAFHDPDVKTKNYIVEEYNRVKK